MDKINEGTREYFKPDDGETDPFRNTRWPIFFGTLTIMGFAMTNFPDTVVTRPHPTFWRLFMGALVGYAIFMTIILLLPKHEAR
jgi:hypothetical protein